MRPALQEIGALDRIDRAGFARRYGAAWTAAADDLTPAGGLVRRRTHFTIPRVDIRFAEREQTGVSHECTYHVEPGPVRPDSAGTRGGTGCRRAPAAAEGSRSDFKQHAVHSWFEGLDREVTEKSRLRSATGDVEKFFDDWVSTRPPLAAALRSSRRPRPFEAEGDYSYSTLELCGDGRLLVGDAGGSWIRSSQAGSESR